MQGPHAKPGDGLRRWVQRIRSSNPRCLYAPWQGSRIDSTWDDHGEAYPRSSSGPGLAIAVALPTDGATYRLSLYFWNDNGHVGPMRRRDFLVQVFPLPKRLWRTVTPPPGGLPSFPRNEQAESWMARAGRSAPLAEGRVVQYWGGAYLRFAISGPGDYMICIRRNHSLNAGLAGFFLDQLGAGAPSRRDAPASAWLAGVPYRPPNPPATGGHGQWGGALAFWRKVRAMVSQPGLAQLAELAVYRYGCASGASAALLARWRWRMGIWTAADRRRFNATMASAFVQFNAGQSRLSALLKAMAQARKKGSRHFVWRGSWANPVKPPVKSR